MLIESKFDRFALGCVHVCFFFSFFSFQISTFANEHYFKEDKMFVRSYLSKNESFLLDVLTFSHEGVVNAHVVLAVRNC